MDQRAYITRAVAALGSHPLRGQLERALQESEPAPLSAPPPGLVAWPVQSKIRVPLFAARTLNATGQYRVTLSLW